jgi:beta-glucosidase
MSAGFAVLTIGAIVAISIVNAEVITPNEGFITRALVKNETKAKNNMGDRLAVEIEQEGIVLAKNDDDCLPLEKSVEKVNVFGYDVVQWVISNSGSGSAGAGSGQKTWGLLEALEDKGIEYNKDVISYYNSWATPRDRGVLSYSSSYETVYRLTNPSLKNNSDYKTVYDNAKGDVDTAIVVIGRWGGEHLDPPHEQVNNYKSSKQRNPDRGYLEITEEEEELLTAVGHDYEHVIVIINSTNTMQMDFMTNIDGLDACLLVGPTGTVGAKAIPQVLWGNVNPSGRTADTWPMKHEYNVAYYTNGYWSLNGDPSKAAEAMYYTNVPSGANLANSKDNAGHGHAVFADYYEGVYVGYKWFETADAEGFWDNAPYNGYENVVAYPFGHGLSYTKFDWEIVDSKPGRNSSILANEEISVSVRVTNTGNVAGRDVVEIYLNAEYYPGEIEKAAVKLVGFQKTKNLIPGESEILEIKMKTRDFMQFDCYDANRNGHAGYELDRGTYELKLMTSAHNMKSNNSSIKFNVPNTIDVDEDPETGAEVKPLFTQVTTEGEVQKYEPIDGVSCDGKSIGEPITYLTREEFAPLMTEKNPTRAWNPGLVTCDDSSKPTAYSTKMANDWDNASTDVFGNPVPTGTPTFGANNDLKVMDEKGQITELGKQLVADYDDPQWDEVLDQLSWSDGITIQKGQSYSRPGMKSVGLTKQGNANFSDAEGACQVGADLADGKRPTAYPDPCVQGQCWNENMCYLFGLSESKDMSMGGKDYLYGPASNIHRNPYGGRHAEYHSEDGFLAGKCLSNVTSGLADGGKGGFIKHFALNDTEYHRVGLFTWCTEQAMREIYLRPFEESIKNGKASALMSSFNRVGAIWTGGSQALMQGVLRNEWGFKGMTITDYTENGTLQDANQQFRAGGNYILASSNFNDPGQGSASNRFKWRLRESAKQVIYGTLRPQYDNDVYNSDTSHKAIISSSKAPYVWWKPVLHCAEAFVIVVLAYCTIACLLPSKKFRQELRNRKAMGDDADELEEQEE